MPEHTLEEVYASPSLTTSKLRQFPVLQLRELCEAKAIDVPGRGKRQQPLKADYIQALLDAVSYDGIQLPDTDGFGKSAATVGRSRVRSGRNSRGVPRRMPEARRTPPTRHRSVARSCFRPK
jgi:hypothetical protein